MKRTEQGFTLVELLAVIAIIGILAALVVGLAGSAQKKSAESQAETDIELLRTAITKYKTDYGKVPGKPSDSEPACRTALSNALVTLKKTDLSLMDPWDEPYHYQATGPETYCLWSTAGDTEGTNRPAWKGNPDPKWNPKH